MKGDPIRNAGHTLTLVETRQPVLYGSFHRCFDGAIWQIVGGAAPLNPRHTGRVECKSHLHGSDSCIFYPSVFKMRWVP